jgi:dTDP-4-dehydrorhamnose reductase
MMPGEAPRPPLELWGGVECTVNRVGDRYFDQIERSGHGHRADDLDSFARLGLTALRYPVLWERTAPDGDLRRADFGWADERLGKLRALGLRPIVGLVHHGSGPRHTSLVDPAFPEGLAAFARAVAERYPWVEDYTPVNEPLTTARFSGLYGHWYPHGRDGATFVRALLVQCRAIVLAMRAVREVNPRARLIQTEDFGRTYSTQALAYQARHENLRRLLSIDLLCGRVDREHPLHHYLRTMGATDGDLGFFLQGGCAPDVIGVNYYVTSDRFLDGRLHRYPAWSHGGNGRQAYADVDAVRVLHEGLTGHLPLLLDLYARYLRPIAITEAHLGGTREEQVRWFHEAWHAGRRARDLGADVRAVTAWSLLGAYDWDSLVVLDRGRYEPGAFDVRGPSPRPTALAQLLRAVADDPAFNDPSASSPGWWRRPVRLLYSPVSAATPAPRAGSIANDGSAARYPGEPEPGSKGPAVEGRPLLLTGASGTLGRAFARICAVRGLPYRSLSRKEMDIAEPAAVQTALSRFSPWAIINAAGYVRVDDAERDAARCERENTRGPTVLAAACAERSIRFVTFSSDLVFGGERSTPYVESDDIGPLGVYGISKALAESHVMKAHPSSLVVRTSAFFGPWDKENFVTVALRALEQGKAFRAAADSVVSPTYVPDLVHATLDLLIDGAAGIWHLANRGAVTWADLVRQCAVIAGINASSLVPCPAAALGQLAPRPAYSALGSQRGLLLPALGDSLLRYWHERDVGPARDEAA